MFSAPDGSNCWEITRCGKEPGGSRVDTSGICPAADCVYATGINGGFHAGRACWAIGETLCGKGQRLSLRKKRRTCPACPVYQKIKAEEGAGLLDTDSILEELNGFMKF